MDMQTRTLSLNGAWNLVLDPEDKGRDARWFDPSAQPGGRTVTVPAVWDLWEPDYDGVGWYFRTFDAPESWRGLHVALQFEAVDYFAEVWLNGQCLGAHEGGYTPFAFDVSAAIAFGSNMLAVRVVDPHAKDGYGDFKRRQIPCAKENGYWSFAGIWGDVTLVARNPIHVTDVFVQPDIRRKRITATVVTSQPTDVRLTIAGTDHTATGPAGKFMIDFPEHEAWSPETPVLYTLVCEALENGDAADTHSVRFGMREFTVRENRFCLNNRAYPVKGVLHQPDYARSLAGPESPELARRELLLAKEAGFNMIRLHIKTAPRITLDLCDELGLLVYAEPPIGWIEKSEWMKERCEREVREMILRDRNHPSIVIWGMLNETGNASYVTHGGAQLVKDDLCRLARSLDPSRLIIDDSGGVNATREPARFIRPYHDEFQIYDDLHIYQRAPVDEEIKRHYLNSGDPDALYFLSEFGFGGMEDLADVIAQYGDQRDRLKDARFLQKMLDAAQQGFAERDLDRIFGSFSGFTAAARDLQCDAVRHQIEAIRANPKVAGYCYTQLCDAGHEFCAGVLDRWRRPKPVHKTLKAIQAPLLPVIQIEKTNLVPRESVQVSVTLVNDDRVECRGDLSLQVVGPTNQVLWKKRRAITVGRGHKEVWSGSIAASGSTGTHRFVVRIVQGARIICQNDIELHVVDAVSASEVPIHVLDPHREWREACLALAKAGNPRSPIHVIPPLANTVRAYPEAELMSILAEVREGAVAIVFSPPDDWNDLADHVDPALKATSKDAVGAFLGIYHYVKLHPIFEGLPARCLMRQPYRNVVPAKTFVESGDDDICGSFDTAPIAAGHYMIGETNWWGSDILVRRYGSGRIVFTHLRVLENLGKDPVADRIFVNMLQHFSRRSVPAEEPPALTTPALDWLKRERADRVRLWMVLGMFPNWGDQGHVAAYQPEQTIDFTATYQGWYKPIRWKRWFSRAEDKHLVNLQDAFSPVYQYYPRFDHGSGYAYAEFNASARGLAAMLLRLQDAAKVWLNGALVHESLDHLPHKTLNEHEVPVQVRQGRNTLLIKVSKIPGEFRFALDIVPTARDPLAIKWWR